MKNISFLPVVLVVFALTHHNNLSANPDNLTGDWSGIFMGQFQINFKFISTGPNTYSGRLTMFDGQHQIQGDKLTRIILNGNDLSFYINAKSTPFTGMVDFDLLQISGKFKFPDGSLHPVTVSKTVKNELSEKYTEPGILNANLPADLLRIDVYFLYAKLRELHPNLYANIEEAEFRSRTNSIAENIDNAESTIKFYKRITTLTDLIGCSHTGLRLPRDMDNLIKQKGNYLTARLFFKNGKAYYLNGIYQHSKIKPGTEILEINSMPVSEIIDDVFAYIPAEDQNYTTKYNEMNRNFPDYFVLIDNSPKFEIVYFNKDKNTVEKTVIPAGNSADSEKIYLKSTPDLGDDFPVKFKLDNDINAGILTIASFGIRDINHYISYMDSIFTMLDEHNINDLIIDLRDNSGGHPIFAAQLFSYLAENPFIYFDAGVSMVDEFMPLYTELKPNQIHFDGQLYVLVNGGCLSTTGHLISLLKFHEIGTFIGEEPGSTYTCNDNSKQLSLPNTGIEANIPTTVFQTAVDAAFFEQHIIVDIPVNIQISDLLTDKDVYLEAACSVIREIGYVDH